jgi:hypothetical protein
MNSKLKQRKTQLQETEEREKNGYGDGYIPFCVR